MFAYYFEGPAEAEKRTALAALAEDAMSRLKAAQTPFELEKAKAIALHVQWRIDQERST